VQQRWARSRIWSPAAFFGFGFEFLGKSRIRYEWYGVYRMYVKVWQRWAQSRIRSLKFKANRSRSRFRSQFFWWFRSSVLYSVQLHPMIMILAVWSRTAITWQRFKNFVHKRIRYHRLLDELHPAMLNFAHLCSRKLTITFRRRRG